MKPLHVITGLPGSGKTSLLRQVAADLPRRPPSLFSYDAPQVSRDGLKLWTQESAAGRIPVTAVPNLSGLLKHLDSNGSLLELGGHLDPLPLLENMAEANLRPASVICVIDLPGFLFHLRAFLTYDDADASPAAQINRAIVRLAFRQAACASLILFNKVADLKPAEKQKARKALLQSNPHASFAECNHGRLKARKLEEIPPFDMKTVRNDRETLKTFEDKYPFDEAAYVIEQTVLKLDRALAPEKFHEIAAAPQEAILRLNGIVWLASKPEQIGRWMSIVPVGGVEGIGHWESLGQRRQEILLTGCGRHAIRSLEEALEAASLDSPSDWSGEDPFPEWKPESLPTADQPRFASPTSQFVLPA